MFKKAYHMALVLLGALLAVHAFLSCEEEKSEDLGENNWVSDCLTLKTTSDTVSTPIDDLRNTMQMGEQASDDNPYCADEKLIWSYDETTGRVSFVDSHVWLNCCGEHSINIYFEEETETYIIEEVDKPETVNGGESRCDCMCFFEFKVELPEIFADAIRLRLTLEVTDAESPKQTVWEGELDLTAAGGEVLIAENVGWCDAN